VDWAGAPRSLDTPGSAPAQRNPGNPFLVLLLSASSRRPETSSGVLGTPPGVPPDGAHRACGTLGRICSLGFSGGPGVSADVGAQLSAQEVSRQLLCYELVSGRVGMRVER
jgi:hypothetical protein